MIKKQIAIIVFAVWLVIISLFMLLTGRFDLALFFILGVIGFLLIENLIELHYVKPGYVLYVRFLIVAGIVTIVVIVVQKVMEILGLEFIIG
jgi:hypothetical protein